MEDDYEIKWEYVKGFLMDQIVEFMKDSIRKDLGPLSPSFFVLLPEGKMLRLCPDEYIDKIKELYPEFSEPLKSRRNLSVARQRFVELLQETIEEKQAEFVLLAAEGYALKIERQIGKPEDLDEIVSEADDMSQMMSDVVDFLDKKNLDLSSLPTSTEVILCQASTKYGELFTKTILVERTPEGPKFISLGYESPDMIQEQWGGVMAIKPWAKEEKSE